MKAEVFDALRHLKKNDDQIEIIQKALEDQDNTITDLKFQLTNRTDEAEISKEKAESLQKEKQDLEKELKNSPFRPDTLEDELKNKILLRLSKNLTLANLEELERSAKEIYFEKNPLSYRD